jgi:radical SAM enzyme (TIGR01210 family)
MNWPEINDAEIRSIRPPKNRVDPWRPYAFLVEPERSATGTIDDVLTVFLTNRECPFHCTMCDLWRNTLDETVPAGAIPAQIDYAIRELPWARHIKLYNAGNFFDARAIPSGDHAEIVDRVRGFETVIVENHPLLTDDRCVRFRDQLDTTLEVALGLETVHPTALQRLNKRMTVDDFDKAVRFLKGHRIRVRTFLLINPPGLNELEGIEWALRSFEHAVNTGVDCVSFIPTRADNGFMEHLEAAGHFSKPTVRSMEVVLERSLDYLNRIGSTARVFMDLWDIASFYRCLQCGPARSRRIQAMNFSQQLELEIECRECGHREQT